MNTKELNKLSIDDLNKLIEDLRKELFALRFQLATGQLEKTHLIKETRVSAARAITVRNLKQQNEEKK